MICPIMRETSFEGGVESNDPAPCTKECGWYDMTVGQCITMSITDELVNITRALDKLKNR